MDPFLGEIRIFPFGYAPNGWLACEGQELQVNKYQALAAVIGNAYGGNWPTTFKLPDLRGRSPLHFGNYSDMTGTATYQMGNATGLQGVTLTVNQIPPHVHYAMALSSQGIIAVPVNAANGNRYMLADPSVTPSQSDGPELYADVPGNVQLTPLRADAVAYEGGGQPHENEQPSLAVYYCIATVGLWPPRS